MKNDTDENVSVNDEVAVENVEATEASDEAVKNEEQGTTVETETDALKKKDEEIASLKELMLRRQADFENFKKRTVKQEENNKKHLIRGIALDIIEINDNLIRASESAVTVPDGDTLEHAHKSYVDGVLMISKSIESMLGKYGIEEIKADNEPFDPNYHEAIDISMSDDVQHDTVTKVFQKGFRFEEFIIRSAKVQVTKPAPKVVEKTEEQTEENKSEK